MNTQILNKCIEELKKDKPDLSYIRGILETVVDSNPSLSYVPAFSAITPSEVKIHNAPSEPIELSDEEREEIELARKYAGGAVAQL